MPKGDHKRGPDGTLQRRAFIVLQKRGSMCASLLAETLQSNEWSVRRAMSYLVPRGFVAKQPYTLNYRRAVIYRAVAGKRPPRDMRGKLKASRNCRGAKAFARWMVMMQKKLGPTWQYKPKVQPGGLEEIWPTIQRKAA